MFKRFERPFTPVQFAFYLFKVLVSGFLTIAAITFIMFYIALSI